jgi:hypothetical protein
MGVACLISVRTRAVAISGIGAALAGVDARFTDIVHVFPFLGIFLRQGWVNVCCKNERYECEKAAPYRATRWARRRKVGATAAGTNTLKRAAEELDGA